MSRATKFTEIFFEEIPNGTGIITRLDTPSDKICIIMSDKRLILFPVIEEEHDQTKEKST